MSTVMEFDIEKFKPTLMETIRWCASRSSLSDPTRCLRTLPARPEQSLIHLTDSERGNAVDALALERREILGSQAGDRPNAPDLVRITMGRLLLFYPDGSLFDGAAEAASEGFIDLYNVSALDTWLYYGSDGSGSADQCNVNLLISWVPPNLVRLVNGAIAVNPENSLEWALTADRNCARALKTNGLLF